MAKVKVRRAKEIFRAMETMLKAHSPAGGAAKEERKVGNIGHEVGCSSQGIGKVGIDVQVHRDNSSKPSPNHENSGTSKEEDELESAKAEMGEVREENERLKTMLQQIEKDYHSLQIRFFDILQQEAKKRMNSEGPSYEEIDEPELVSLRLGRSTPSEPKKDENNSNSGSKTRDDQQLKEGLTLGLDLKFEVTKPDSDLSPENSLGETKDEEPGETRPPSNVPKTMRNEDDDPSQQSQVKRARVSVRVRCDTATMNDGCQWRKYGQKIAKGNPCPRAYYRCTVAAGCPVRKQVQRCAEDMSILITTYEGTHNHPLPIGATAMASTTSAAVSMLNSSSSTSQPGLIRPSASTTAATDFHGLHFSLADNSRTRQFCSLNSYSSPAFPTITLDLTTAPCSSSNYFNKLSSSFPLAPRFPSTSLSFSSSESNILPSVVWGNGYLSQYGTLPYNKTPINGSLSNLGRAQSHEHVYQPYVERNNQASSQLSLTDTLTKAITSDPSFQSVVATAISSMVRRGGENYGQNLKCGEPISASSVDALTRNGKKCASSYSHQSSSSNSQTGSSMLLQSPLPISISNNTSGPAADKKDKINR